MAKIKDDKGLIESVKNVVKAGSRTKTGTVSAKTNELAVQKRDDTLLEILHAGHVDIDAIRLDNLAECEKVIKNMMAIKRVSALAIAIMITHIRDKKLFPQDMTWPQYRAQGEQRLGMDRRNVWRYEQTGDNYVMYGIELQNIGFSEHGDVSKLLFLNAAVVQHGKKKAFKNFSEMSTQEFAAWARGKIAKIPYKGIDFGVTANALLYHGKEVISFDAIQDIQESGKIEEFKKMVAKLRRG